MWVFAGKILEMTLLLLWLDGFFNKATLLVNLKRREFLLLNMPNGLTLILLST